MSFDEYFSANLPRCESFHPHFNDALAWILKAGGKHFRAKLLLGVVGAYAPNSTQNAYPIAAGLEMMHAYSLIHDDLPAMDNAPLRRGVATLHVKYDEITAILVGDTLNTHAFYMISTANLPAQNLIKCVRILSANAGIYGMALGQAIDCHFENKGLSLDELKFLHSKKTGALIAASMEMGAVVVNLSEEECARIHATGLDLGLAFQIQDDIIDATKDEKSAGKPVQNDSAKNSFTNLLGVKGAIKARDELENKIMSDLANSPILPLVRGLIDKYLKG